VPKEKKVLLTVARAAAPHVLHGRYFGIDQSMTGTGIACFDDQGALVATDLFSTKPPVQPMDEVLRITSLFASCYNFINGHSQGKPSCIIMEDFAFSQANQMALLGGLGWHFRIMLAQTTFHFGTCGTGTLKKVATGSGNGDKTAVALGVYKRWQFEGKDDNVTDAYVLGKICWVTYAKPLPGSGQTRTVDFEALPKIKIYR
jgi:hypothetical protein